MPRVAYRFELGSHDRKDFKWQSTEVRVVLRVRVIQNVPIIEAMTKRRSGHHTLKLLVIFSPPIKQATSQI